MCTVLQSSKVRIKGRAEASQKESCWNLTGLVFSDAVTEFGCVRCTGVQFNTSEQNIAASSDLRRLRVQYAELTPGTRLPPSAGARCT